MKRHSLPLIVLLTAVALPPLVGRAQSPTVYNPALGTLPQNQGWTVQDTDAGSTPTVTGGLLLQGPTSNGGVEYWQSQAPMGVTWDFSRDTLTLTARLNVVTSNYYNSGGLRRAGYYLFANDTQGRFFQFAVASDRVFLDRDNNAPSGGPSQILFDTTGFHDYRVVISPTGAQAFIDNTLVTSAALGPTGATGAPGTVSFGDESILAGSQTQLASVQYTVTPEPSSLAILTLGLCGVGGLSLQAVRRQAAKEGAKRSPDAMHLSEI